MVICNPRLSLPKDLPYKKRQMPFFPNTPLQQATIRYNEKIRKQYNDTQNEMRIEKGLASHAEVLGVNTIELSKTIDPKYFNRMSNTKALMFFPVKRRSKMRDDSPDCKSHSHANLGNGRMTKNGSCSLESMEPMGAATGGVDTGHTSPRASTSFDCNCTEMFPHLQAPTKLDSNKSSSCNYFPAKSQAINEYEPTNDSAHDMIFGNVMGLDYGNYMHGPLWGPPQQPPCCIGRNPDHRQHYPTAPPSLCCATKFPGNGYNPCMQNGHNHNQRQTFRDLNGTANENENEPPWCQQHVVGRHYGGPQGVGRRSCSVPGPRASGGQKETLKQAAIRCGIIKGNHTVASIPTRSQLCPPLPLTPVQSDPAVPVVEILQPKSNLQSCSSEDLVEFEDLKFKNPNPGCKEGDGCVLHKSVPVLNIAATKSSTDLTKVESPETISEKSSSDSHEHVFEVVVSNGALETASSTLEPKCNREFRKIDEEEDGEIRK